MTAAVILKYHAEEVGGGLKVDMLVMAAQLIDFPKPSRDFIKKDKKGSVGHTQFLKDVHV